MVRTTRVRKHPRRKPNGGKTKVKEHMRKVKTPNFRPTTMVNGVLIKNFDDPRVDKIFRKIQDMFGIKTGDLTPSEFFNLDMKLSKGLTANELEQEVKLIYVSQNLERLTKNLPSKFRKLVDDNLGSDLTFNQIMEELGDAMEQLDRGIPFDEIVVGKGPVRSQKEQERLNRLVVERFIK